ncbi:hypothetical protein [Streptomyces sp. H27-D2]|uniref:hypothetical protein n=1 Tax=Streptomyces sp. H27-D2 TaxID=3046304 RepID=UPI002DB652C0|nr:hypothetical protein [Streptomyces sp. H27-D2]MEC4016074.1 hypothetical protein [Streptomyces sp. H27-D2]
MTHTPTSYPMSKDDLVDWLSGRIAEFDPDERITPLTLIAAAVDPGLGWTRADLVLRALADSGVLHSTERASVYTLRPDLPARGTGHVWFRLTNRARSAVEVVAEHPLPREPWDSDHTPVTWRCAGCPATDSVRYKTAARDAIAHAETCRGLPISV